MTSYAIDAEIDLLRRLYRGVRSELAALQELPERSPEDELRLRSLMRLARRLSDRIEALSGGDDACLRQRPVRQGSVPSGSRAPLGVLFGRECAAAAPESS